MKWVERRLMRMQRESVWSTAKQEEQERLSPVSTTRVDGPSWRVTGFHYPSTRSWRARVSTSRFNGPYWRPDNSGSGNRALVLNEAASIQDTAKILSWRSSMSGTYNWPFAIVPLRSLIKISVLIYSSPVEAGGLAASSNGKAASAATVRSLVGGFARRIIIIPIILIMLLSTSSLL